MKKQTSLFAAVVLFCGIALASTANASPANASPANANQVAAKNVAVVHASFDTAELQKNLSTNEIKLSTDQLEKVTFKVSVDVTGAVEDLTYTHNISAESAKKTDACIAKAYKAIMATEFYPAKKDGKNIADVVTIEFVVVD
ncbi:MAG: hypothetical protein HQ472_01700 [Ignavibacteria bacterium]|nr:hypothetical protein [Ignavibacteria bacterium]